MKIEIELPLDDGKAGIDSVSVLRLMAVLKTAWQMDNEKVGKEVLDQLEPQIEGDGNGDIQETEED